MKIILSLIIGGALIVSGFGQTRNVLVGTNNSVVQPTNFWSADASNARAGLGLGTAATNPATAFQSSSATLSNLATANGGSLTNLQSSSLVGVIPSSNIPSVTFTGITGTLSLAQGGTGATNASDARQNLGLGLPALTNTNVTNFRTDIGLGATNNVTFEAVTTGTGGIGVGDASARFSQSTSGGGAAIGWQGSGQRVTFLSGIGMRLEDAGLALAFGTNNTNGAAISRTNLGLGAAWLTNTDVTNFRTAIGLGATWLTNTDVTNFRTAIGLGTTNLVTFGRANIADYAISESGITGFTAMLDFENVAFHAGVDLGNVLNWDLIGSGFDRAGRISFTNAAAASATRTNLGLPWSGLTNTNAATFQTALFGANTNPVLVDTNGEVVSPTNFWQAAPITTTFIESQPSTNSTTNVPAARFLHIHSLNTNVTVINTIVLPTNGSTYNGDVALIVHQGLTNSMTRVRAAGLTNDIATMTRYNEAIEFVYYNNGWTFNHNQAFTEPVYFAGTNALGHAAESRTNLGLGATWLTNTNVTNFRTAIGLGSTNVVFFESVGIASELEVSGQVILNDSLLMGEQATINFGDNVAATRTNLGLGATWLTNTDVTNFRTAIGLGTANNAQFAAVEAQDLNGYSVAVFSNLFIGEGATLTFDGSDQPNFRSSLGLGLPALTNTNNANFRDAIELGATNNVLFSNVTASGTLTATGTVTATTNLVVNGYVDFSTNHTNVAPAINNQVQKWLQIRIGTNAYFLPLYQ